MTFSRDASLGWISIDSNVNNIFKNMTENRKRSREDDACEFMPLSKRINNLHINSLSSTTLPQSHETNHNRINTENGISSPSSSVSSERRPSYDPGINSSDSNYYYDNKLLFELHLERIQRSGQLFPF